VEHVARDYYPGHFPAHKGGKAWPGWWRRLVGDKLAALDLTELPGLDDLHHPQGPIARAQELTARLAGAGRSYFLVNGTTVGLLAALLGMSRPDEPVLVPRCGHRSLVGAAILAGIRPVFLRDSFDRTWDLPLGIDRAEAESALASHPGCRLLVLVYPTYEGVAWEIGPLIEWAHSLGMTVVVDQAHGAHFGKHPRFPPSALDLGADVVVEGWHKTLGSLTQTAVLHLRHGLDEGGRVVRALDLLQSTSPSYPLLASLDAMQAHLARRGAAAWEEALAAVDELRGWLKARPEFELWEGPGGECRDPLRLVISAAPLGVEGRALAEILREEGRVQVEAWGRRHVLLLFSLADGAWSIPRVRQAFSVLLSRPLVAKPRAGVVGYEPRPGRPVLTPREAFMAPHRWVPLDAAAGEIAAQALVPYPPGIPLCWPGELIGKDLVAYLRELQAWGHAIQGLTDEGEVAVVGE